MPSPTAMPSQAEDARRHSRHAILPHFGAVGQARLAQGHLLMVGAGGLGSPALTYLASGGIGRITLLDPDRVEASNLPRQVLFETGDIGRLKVDAARDRLEELNPDLRLVSHPARFEEALAAQPGLLQDVDAVLDGCDRFTSRLTVNAASVAARKPLISGAMLGWEGQVGLFAGHRADAPCYQCLVSSQPSQTEDCRSNGVIAPLGGVIGSLMALEAFKLLTGAGEGLLGRIMQFDALAGKWRESRLPKDPGCAVCAVP